MLRVCCSIERLVNLISLAYAGMLILTYTEDEFACMRDVSPQDIRFEIGTILRDKLFSAKSLFLVYFDEILQSQYLKISY